MRTISIYKKQITKKMFFFFCSFSIYIGFSDFDFYFRHTSHRHRIEDELMLAGDNVGRDHFRENIQRTNSIEIEDNLN